MSDIGDTRVGVFSDSCMSGGEDLDDTDAEFNRHGRKSLSLKGTSMNNRFLFCFCFFRTVSLGTS